MKCTEYAAAYTAARRKAARSAPTWGDVAAAYDQGLRHALSIPISQQRMVSRVIRVLLTAHKEVTKS